MIMIIYLIDYTTYQIVIISKSLDKLRKLHMKFMQIQQQQKMLIPKPYQQISKKSKIKFSKNVAAPKQIYKSQSSNNIYTSMHSLIQIRYWLQINLSMQKQLTQSLEYNYNEQTKVKDLIEYLKNKLGNTLVYFKSGNVLIDHFLTLQNHNLIELNMSSLNLKAISVHIFQSITLSSLEIIKSIGSGGFSKVVLARLYGIIMAIKIVDKDFLIQNSKQAIVENEKQVLQLCSGHPFITKLYLTLQTNNSIIFGIEYCNGGELFNLLRKVKKMHQQKARFYFMETLLAIQFLHSKGILYRDLKPQNIILDSEGHVRLADYGLSKVINRSVTYSYCGSAEYMSPEMLLKKGHSYEVDYYCLGALLYQLVTGLPPFYCNNQSELFSKILNDQLTFPSHAMLSNQLKIFLIRMLQKNPELRFGSIQEILDDPWVKKSATVEEYLNKKIKPPYETATFCFNFDKSTFGFTQEDLLKTIEAESKVLTTNRIFDNFYFEGEQIEKIKNQFYVRNFSKIKNSEIQSSKYTPFPNSSIYLSTHYNPKSLNDSQNKQSRNSLKFDYAHYEKNNRNLSHKIHMKSSDNVRSTFANYIGYERSPENSLNSNRYMIYSNKPRMSAPVQHLRKQKSWNQLYNISSSSVNEMKIDRGVRQGGYWKSQEKTNIKNYYNSSGNSQQLGWMKNHLAQIQLRLSVPKVMKLYKPGEKLNFYYGTTTKK